MSRTQIDQILSEDLDRATEQYGAAVARFRAALQAEARQQADDIVSLQSQARLNLSRALQRFNNFVVKGIVPEDLRPAV